MIAQATYPVIDMAETGRRIERCRREAGLTVRDLQDYFGFEYPQAIYKWQRGKSLPTVDNLLALARLLRVPMEDLLVCEDRGSFALCMPWWSAYNSGAWRPTWAGRRGRAWARREASAP